MALATITAKGQMTLPKEVREAMGLRPGDRVKIFVDRYGDARIAREVDVSELSGILHRPGMKAATVEEMDEGIAEAVAERDLSSLSPAGRRAAARRQAHAAE